MTRLNLDNQPAVVRDFMLALSATSGSVVLESAGKAIACVVPAPQANEFMANDDWTDEKNARRVSLLDRKYEGGLTEAQEAELILLQDAMHRHIDRVAPLPLDEVRRVHQELLLRMASPPRNAHSSK